MSQDRPDFQFADARVNGTTGAIRFTSGTISNVVRTAVGIYEVTLSPGADQNQHTVMLQAESTLITKTTLAIEWISSTLIRVRAVGVI